MGDTTQVVSPVGLVLHSIVGVKVDGTRSKPLVAVVTFIVAMLFLSAATPPIIVGEMRVIPAMMLLIYILIILTLYCNGKIYYNIIILIAIAILSMYPSIIYGKYIIYISIYKLIYQYFFVIIGYAIFKYINMIKYSKLILIGFVFISTAAILQSLGVLPGANQVEKTLLSFTFHRAQLFFSQPNGLANYMILLIPLLMLARGGRVVRVLQVAAIAGLVVTFSRSALLALPTSLVFTMMLRTGRIFRVVGAVAYFAILIFILSPLPYNLVSDFAVSRNVSLDYATNERIQLMQAGLAMFYDHYATGVGAGGFPIYLHEYNTSLDPNLRIPHNTVIQVALEQGLLGLFAYALLIAVAFMSSGGAGRIGFVLAWSFWASTMNSLFEWQFIHGYGELYMLVFGMLIAHARSTRIEGHDRSGNLKQGRASS